MKIIRVFFLLVLLGIVFSLPHSYGQQAFRIFPYLQVSDNNLVQVRWFSDQSYPSSISFKDSKGTVLLTANVQGREMSELYYTDKEKSQVITGLEGVIWIGSNNYFRYEYSYRLPANELISYTVTLNGQQFNSTFRTAPDSQNWESIRFIALSDSETEPKGRVTNRAWYPGQPLVRPFSIPTLWKQRFGTTTEQGIEIPNYFLNEKDGYTENLKIVTSRNPNLLLMPGDLVQSGGYMPAWDEFWRHNSGEFGLGLTSYPIVPALGNWESDGGINGGYGLNERGTFNPVLGRSRFHAFFEIASQDPLQKHRQSYYRTDYGPITILTLDSSNGTPEQTRSDTPDAQKLKNKEYTGPGTDTQENYTQTQYQAAGGTDLSGFGPGSDQYVWLEQNLKDAADKGKLVFVQFHHIAFSSGEHGVPMNHELSTGQGGTPLRALHPLFEEYGVIAVFSGHDELFERSFVDSNNDGKGVQYYDVGVAGDGMRGVKRNLISNPLATLDYNEFSQWTADQKSTEIWDNSGTNPVLTDGGKHYGHLEVNVKKVLDGGKTFAQIDFEPVYAFPVMNAQYQLQRVERRVYSDPVRILVELKITEPVVVPQFKTSIQVELNAEGRIETKPSDYLVNAIQPDWTITYSRSNIFTCTDLGLREITVTVKNALNQTWSAKVNVEVLDKIAPDFEATDAFLAFDKVVGKVTIDAESFYIRTEFITENCLSNGGITIDFDKKEFTCADLTGEPIPVRITLTDRSGNATTKIRKVNLNPIESKKISISPAESYQGIVGETVEIKLGEEFAYTVDAWLKDGQVIPAEKLKSINVTQSGTYWARVIPSGGCSVETLAVTVNLLTRPYGPLKNPVELNLNSTGKATLSPSGVFLTWPLSDPSLVVTLSQTEFSCQDIGEKEVTVTIKNQLGQTWTEKTKVKVQDKVAPLLETMTPSLDFDKAIGILNLNLEDFVASLSDNCGIKSLELNKSQFTCSDLDSPLEVIVSATDFSGNTTSKVVQVALSTFESKKISINPSGSAQGFNGESVTLSLGAEFEYTVEEWLKDGVKLNASKEKTTAVTQAGTYWARIRSKGGCLLETLKVAVTFIDKPYPNLKASNELVLDASGKAVLKPENVFVTWPPTGPSLDVSLSQSDFACTDIGEKEITVTIKVQGGQTYSEKTRVTVKDTTAPLLTTKTPSLAFDLTKGELLLNAQDFVATVTDNCAVKSVTLNKSKITCADFDLPIDLILTATDNSGNETSKTITVAVSRFESKKITINPSGSSQAYKGETVTLSLGAEFEYTVEEWLKDGLRFNPVKEKTISVTETGTYWARILPKGGCVVETLRATVTFIDKPYPSLKASNELLLDDSGKAVLKPENVFVTWPPSVPNLDIRLSQSEFGCTDIGEKEITVTIKNQTGQTWVEKTLVVVKDTTAPLLTTKTPNLAFDLTKGELLLNADDFVASVTDNCSVQSLVLNKSKITCADFDLPIEVILTATDKSGNKTSETITVSVSPFESKKISISPQSGSQYTVGEDAEIRLGEEFAFGIEGWYRDGVLLTGEKGKAILVRQSGTYWARIVPEGGGCSVETSKTQVIFNPLPFGEIKERVILPLGTDGKADLTPQAVFVSWPQPDPNLEYTFSQKSFTCQNLGQKEINLTIKNAAGKSWERKFTVEIKDTTKPILSTRAVSLNLDVTKGFVEVSADELIASVADNCGVKSITLSKNRFVCEDVNKDFPVGIRVEDTSGNVTEGTAVVTIKRIENQVVSITGDSEICEGETSTLTLSSPVAFEVIRWRRNGTEIPGQTGKSLEVTQSGKYHAVIRYPGACVSETAELEMKVNPKPSGEIVTDGNILRAPEGSFTYQWFRNGEKLNGATSRTLVVDLMGEYQVELISTSGCVAKLKSVTLTISGLGGNWVSKPKALKIYPNPAVDVVTLELPDGVLASKPEIVIYASDGKNVSNLVQITILNSLKVELRLTNFAKGTYLVWVIGQNQQSHFGKLLVLD
jgi:hypothetical protein